MDQHTGGNGESKTPNTPRTTSQKSNPEPILQHILVGNEAKLNSVLAKIPRQTHSWAACNYRISSKFVSGTLSFSS